MNFLYKDLNIYYEVYGQGERLVLIHGWGGSDVWSSYINNFAEMGVQLFVITLPGFGTSDTPKEIIDSYFYADMVKAFLDELEIERPIVMGHSLGGKVAAILQTKYDIASKLILVDSAGFKRFYLTVFVKNMIAKIGKRMLELFARITKKTIDMERFMSMFGSRDYRNAGEMRDSFKKIVKEDIRDKFSEISVPTLVIWGDADKETPLIDGVEISRFIKDSQLKIIKDANHFPFITNTATFFKLVKDFVES